MAAIRMHSRLAPGITGLGIENIEGFDYFLRFLPRESFTHLGSGLDTSLSRFAISDAEKIGFPGLNLLFAKRLGRGTRNLSGEPPVDIAPFFKIVFESADVKYAGGDAWFLAAVIALDYDVVGGIRQDAPR